MCLASQGRVLQDEVQTIDGSKLDRTKLTKVAANAPDVYYKNRATRKRFWWWGRMRFTPLACILASAACTSRPGVKRSATAANGTTTRADTTVNAPTATSSTDERDRDREERWWREIDESGACGDYLAYVLLTKSSQLPGKYLGVAEQKMEELMRQSPARSGDEFCSALEDEEREFLSELAKRSHKSRAKVEAGGTVKMSDYYSGSSRITIRPIDVRVEMPVGSPEGIVMSEPDENEPCLGFMRLRKWRGTFAEEHVYKGDGWHSCNDALTATGVSGDTGTVDPSESSESTDPEAELPEP